MTPAFLKNKNNLAVGKFASWCSHKYKIRYSYAVKTCKNISITIMFITINKWMIFDNKIK
jgi:hypothetical protein